MNTWLPLTNLTNVTTPIEGDPPPALRPECVPTMYANNPASTPPSDFFFEVQYCMRIVDRLWFDGSPHLPFSSPFLASTHTPLNPQLCLNEGKSTACQCKCLGKASLFFFSFVPHLSFFFFFSFFLPKERGKLDNSTRNTIVHCNAYDGTHTKGIPS